MEDQGFIKVTFEEETHGVEMSNVDILQVLQAVKTLTRKASEILDLSEMEIATKLFEEED